MVLPSQSPPHDSRVAAVFVPHTAAPFTRLGEPYTFLFTKTLRCVLAKHSLKKEPFDDTLLDSDLPLERPRLPA